MLFRTLNGLMAVLFAVAVAVQYNDPDPLRWMLMYGAACLVSIVAAVRGRVWAVSPAAVGLVALAWGAYWATSGGEAPGVYRHMFDAWEMRSLPIEEAREASGLVIVAVWMAVLTIRALRTRP